MWACKKFSRYLVGIPTFESHTDHKPLVPLLTTKNLTVAPVRCRKDADAHAQVQPKSVSCAGKATGGGRHSLSKASSKSSNGLRWTGAGCGPTCWGYNHGMATDRLEPIRQVTDVDEDVAEYVALGRPDSPQKLPGRLLPYHAEHAELSLLDGVVTHGDWIVLPKAQRGETLECLHESHQGLERTRERAHCAVWWPGITMDIKAVSDCCAECRERRPSQNHEPLKTLEPAARPWEKVAVDLLTFRGHVYLVLVDAYSMWLEIKHLKSTTYIFWCRVLRLGRVAQKWCFVTSNPKLSRR